MIAILHRIMDIEQNVKTASFWLRLGVINHCVALAVIAFGCAYSGITGIGVCQGEAMKDVLSIYAFTIFTPQLALEVILLIALFLMINSLQQLQQNKRSLILFLGTFLLLTLFVYWQ
ncbi:MAG: putative membrane protein [Arenicella sp.]|jgi:uncharacterized membrane protein